MEEAVRVLTRVRPLSTQEESCAQVKGNSILVDKNSFTFDRVFDSQCSQLEVYESVQDIVTACLNGFSGTIFAYGQTSSGKSFTMSGDSGDKAGITLRSFLQIFDHISRNISRKYVVCVSFMELYNEEVRDLLNSGEVQKLDIKEQKTGGFFVKGLTKHVVSTIEEMTKLLFKGQKQRATGSTSMNEQSSRSHSIFTVTIESCGLDKDPESQKLVVGKLNLVDLAGSERQNKTNSTGQRLKEATKINLSLAALGNVISALSFKDTTHIPYRDSKLTKLLMDSLGGSSKTVMIATVSPSRSNAHETISTLRYAQRAKDIKNKPQVNYDATNSILIQYQTEIQLLRAQLEARKDQTQSSGDQFQQTSLEQQRKQLSDSYQQVVDERKKLELQLNDHQLQLQQEKIQQEDLVSKLQKLENSVLIGGADLQERVQKQAEILQQHQSNLQHEQALEQTLTQRMDMTQKTGVAIEQRYSSLQDEAQVKGDKLQKLLSKAHELQDLKVVQQIKHRKERQQLLQNIHDLDKEIKLMDLMIDRFIPQNILLRMQERAIYDEVLEDWIIVPVHKHKATVSSVPSEPLPFLGPADAFRYPVSQKERDQYKAGDTDAKYRLTRLLEPSLEMLQATPVTSKSQILDFSEFVALNRPATSGNRKSPQVKTFPQPRYLVQSEKKRYA